MKHLLASLFMIFTMQGCTLSPLSLPFEDYAMSQSTNDYLLCANKIDVYPLSINVV